MEEIGYKKLIVWKRADELVFLVCRLTSIFPKTELYALTSQLRRAALSVPTNIVEGYARNSNPEFKRFIVISLGSLAETKYLIDVSRRLKYIKEDDYLTITQMTDEVGRLLWKFYRSF